jgi:phosphoglycolate phosphatase
VQLLVLFDVDGTLLVSDDPLVGRATCDAIDEVYGLRAPADAMSRVDHAGRTSRWIMRQIMRAQGIDDEEVTRGLGAWCEAVSARYVDMLAGVSPDHWKSPPGTAEALEKISGFARIALLTGNPEPIARARMERLGLARLFSAGEGAFGCEADERPELITIARRRAGDWPVGRTVEVGDTPLDVAGAHAAGVLSVAVCWGRFSRPELAGADAFVDSMAELPEALERLAAGAAEPRG